MPYFAIRGQGEEIDVCICQEEKIDDIDPDSFLGSKKVWEVREIDAIEAGILLFKLGSQDSNLENLVRYVSMRLSDTPFGD